MPATPSGESTRIENPLAYDNYFRGIGGLALVGAGCALLVAVRANVLVGFSPAIVGGLTIAIRLLGVGIATLGTVATQLRVWLTIDLPRNFPNLDDIKYVIKNETPFVFPSYAGAVGSLLYSLHPTFRHAPQKTLKGLLRARRQPQPTCLTAARILSMEKRWAQTTPTPNS